MFIEGTHLEQGYCEQKRVVRLMKDLSSHGNHGVIHKAKDEVYDNNDKPTN